MSRARARRHVAGAHARGVARRGINHLNIEPCSLDCEYFLFVVSESEKAGAQVSYVDLR